MFIYVITCGVNGKKYVGYDTGVVEELRRWKLHCALKKPKHESKLYPAMVKYGVENFSVDIVAEATSMSELRQLEIDWIAKLDSIKNGYNIRSGGQGFSPLRSLPKDEAEKQLNAIKRGSIAANAKRWSGKTLEERRAEVSKAVASYSSENRRAVLKALWADPAKRAERIASMQGKKKNKKIVCTK